jgi:hypothetical protein
LIKGHVESRGVSGAVEPFIGPGQMPDHRLRPRFGGICSRTDLSPTRSGRRRQRPSEEKQRVGARSRTL